MGKKPMGKRLPIGAVILAPGSSVQYKTAGWWMFRPVYNRAKCNKCGLCWVYCPDVAISIKKDGFCEFDLDYCKGCGICAKECPMKAIVMVEESA